MQKYIEPFIDSKEVAKMIGKEQAESHGHGSFKA